VDQNHGIALPIVLGPTGSGKSDLALSLAQALGGELVGCDSLQVYRGFDLGTAKLRPGERRGIPHHLLDVVEPVQLFTAGDYARLARACLQEIAGRNHLPVVVGGTGFYLRAMLEGLFPGPERSPEIRDRLARREQRRGGSLHRILSRLDPEAATRIHASDKNKTIRALEVRLLEGRPLSALFALGREPLTGFRPVKLGLDPPREMLNRRLDARTERMFESGLVAEARALLAAGVPANAKPFESLGYRQALDVIAGRLTPEQALASTQTATRQYAKRQITWFRKEQDVHWLPGFGDDPDLQRRALDLVRQSL